MKKIYLTFLILITLFIFNAKASAITCKYTGSNDDSAQFESLPSDLKTPSVTIKNKNVTTFSETSVSITNWSSGFAGFEAGKVTYGVASSCPDKLILVHIGGKQGQSMSFKLYLYVLNTSDLDAYKKAIEDKYKGKGVLYEMSLVDSFNNTPTEEDTPSSCLAFKEDSCTTNKYFSCLWIEKGEYKYCSSNNLLYVTCGDIKDIPEQVPRIMSFIINLLKIVVPILLVLVSIINILKALASSKEDEIKKAQSTLIKKIIAAVMAFLVVSIVQFVINKVADSDEEKGNIASCLDCFLNNNCSSNIYYKNNVAGTDYCAYLGEDEAYNCNNKIEKITIGDWGKNKIKHRTTGEQE